MKQDNMISNFEPIQSQQENSLPNQEKLKPKQYESPEKWNKKLNSITDISFLTLDKNYDLIKIPSPSANIQLLKIGNNKFSTKATSTSQKTFFILCLNHLSEYISKIIDHPARKSYLPINSNSYPLIFNPDILMTAECYYMKIFIREIKGTWSLRRLTG